MPVVVVVQRVQVVEQEQACNRAEQPVLAETSELEPEHDTSVAGVDTLEVSHHDDNIVVDLSFLRGR